MAPPRHDRDGSVLPTVLIFSIIAALIVAAFVSGQYMLARPTLSAPSELQALCNARSGVWKAVEMLNRHGRPDSLKGINTLDTAFTNNLLGKPKDSIDSASLSDKILIADSTPVTVKLYSTDSCDSFGTCEVALSYYGCFERLSSKGSFRKIEKNVEVTLGGVAAFSPDTAYYLETGFPLQGNIWGKGHIGMDTSVIVREEDLKALMSRYSADLSSGVDTIVPQPPLTIQHNDEFEKIPDFVKGPLFIDGSHFDLSWKQKRRVTVLGDVQITGKVSIEDVELVASGEIKCFDDSKLSNVTLLAAQRVVMSDRAVFSGTAIAAANMLFYGQASVERRSMLIVTGEGKIPKNPQSNAGGSGHGGGGGQAQLRVFSITFTETSTIDATVIALKSELGVRIDRNAAVKGVIWTKGWVSLAGKLYGVVHAKALVDPENALDPKIQLKPSSILPGSAAMKRIDDLDRYYFPFFMGKLAVIRWQE